MKEREREGGREGREEKKMRTFVSNSCTEPHSIYTFSLSLMDMPLIWGKEWQILERTSPPCLLKHGVTATPIFYEIQLLPCNNKNEWQAFLDQKSCFSLLSQAFQKPPGNVLLFPGSNFRRTTQSLPDTHHFVCFSFLSYWTGSLLCYFPLTALPYLWAQLHRPLFAFGSIVLTDALGSSFSKGFPYYPACPCKKQHAEIRDSLQTKRSRLQGKWQGVRFS